MDGRRRRRAGRRASVDDPEAQRHGGERDRTTRVCYHWTGHLGSSCLSARHLPHCSSEPPCLSRTLAGRLAHASIRGTLSRGLCRIRVCTLRTTTVSDMGQGAGSSDPLEPSRAADRWPWGTSGACAQRRNHWGVGASHSPSEDRRPRAAVPAAPFL